MYKGQIAMSYGMYTNSFHVYCQTIFSSGCANFLSHKEYESSCFLISVPGTDSLFFFDVDFLLRIGYLTVVWFRCPW